MLHALLRTACLAAIVAGLLLTTGCDSDEAKRPALADSTFVAVLAELHLARARQDLQDDLPRSIRDSIFDRYHTDSTRFQQTVSYYTDHPEAYTQIYNRVVDHLNEARDAEPASAATVDSSKARP